jgi:Pyruvate/2-oxoacid:ferredoxin oxidoreductase delta subunit
MTQQVYRDLLTVMQKRRGPYAGADIPEFFAMVEALFSPEEADVNNALPRTPVTAAEAAEAAGRSKESITPILEAMADKGLCKTFLRDGVRYYQGQPFMPGIFEYQFISGKSDRRHEELARLVHDYKRAYTETRGEAKMTFPTTRVIPVDRTIDAGNTVHTYDQVATYIQKYDPIAVGTCFCRQEALLRGEDIHGMPMNVCMWFGGMGAYAIERLGARQETKEGAMRLLQASEEAGLVHMSRNTTEDINFICNCDRWHCEIISGVLKQSKPALFFNSGFEPQFDPEKCVACEACIDRCPPGALSMGDQDLPVVDLDRCFGCAVCASGCPEEAIAMETKPGFPEPPKDVKELIAGLKAAARR